MEYTYHTSDLVACRRTELTLIKSRKTDYYYRVLGLPLIALSAGLVLLFRTPHDLFALWVMLMAGSFLAKVKSHQRLYHDACYPPGTDPTPMLVTLRFTPVAMEERVAGVTSSAPWSMVTDATIMDDLLIIQLASRQQALVPRNPVDLPALNLEEIRDQILVHQQVAARLSGPLEKNPPAVSPTAAS